MEDIEVKADLCPVCNGTGKYKEYNDLNYTNATHIERTCHGCNGKGWVTIPIYKTSITRG